jgi:hypothetical protein
MLAGLETEHRFLEKQNWTWQFRPEGLESIRPIAVWIRLGAHADAWSNVEQFLAFHGDINRQVERNDATVHELTAACKKCHVVLVQNPELTAAYCEALSPESVARLTSKYPIRSQGSVQVELSAKSLAEEYFGGYPPTDHVALSDLRCVLPNVGRPATAPQSGRRVRESAAAEPDRRNLPRIYYRITIDDSSPSSEKD